MIRRELIGLYQESQKYLAQRDNKPWGLAALLDEIVILAGDLLHAEYVEKYPGKHCRTPTSRGPECQHDWTDSDWQAEARRILEGGK